MDTSLESPARAALAANAWQAFARGVAVLWRRQLRGMLSSPSELGGALAMPILWMVLFGLCMGQTVTDPARTGGIGYIAFITPGVMLLSALTAAAMAGATLLLDRLSGALKLYLIAPIPHAAVLAGLLSSALTKAVGQGALVLLMGLLLGARLATAAPDLLLALALLCAFTAGFAGLAAAFAGRVRTMEGYHGLIMLLNLPMLFISNALYPLDAMPPVIRTLAYFNPTTYAIDALRHLLFGAPAAIGLLPDSGALLAFATLGMVYSRRRFARTVRQLTT
ncbi:ABC transporter [Chloroflexia bacterium SDU3-3]|nr:ABC transporter [Chloroflexia bacterium SDU3-3]